MGAFALVNYTTGNVDAARTTAFMTLVMAQIVHSLECRSETKGLFQSGVRDNLWLLSAGAFSLLMMLAVVYVPALQGVFKTIELSVSQLGIVACFTVFYFAITLASTPFTNPEDASLPYFLASS